MCCAVVAYIGIDANRVCSYASLVSADVATNEAVDAEPALGASAYAEAKTADI